MIITRRTAQSLIRQGKAQIVNRVIDGDVRWDVLARWDLQRTDHVRMDRHGYLLQDARKDQ
jgi:hypothetical protein